jgi:hypothetical protein
MSLQFNDTSTYKGIVQIYEKECGMDRGFISDNSDRLKELTADVNLAFDDFTAIAIPASGTWQFDDSNHTKYPIIKTNLVSSQRDYAFTVDEQANLILDIYKVLVLPSANATIYQEITPFDELNEVDNDVVSENTATGTPWRYGKLSNGLFLDPLPSYNATNGLKVFLNREASYFTSSDTTKKPGVPGLFHRWFAIFPALDYARRNNLATYQTLALEVERMKKAIKEYYSRREKDVRPVMTSKKINYI